MLHACALCPVFSSAVIDAGSVARDIRNAIRLDALPRETWARKPAPVHAYDSTTPGKTRQTVAPKIIIPKSQSKCTFFVPLFFIQLFFNSNFCGSSQENCLDF